MSTCTLIANIIFSLLLYFVNGLIGKFKTSSWVPFEYSSFGFHNTKDKNFSDNFLQSIVHPTIYLAIISAILQNFAFGNIASDLWLVVPLYWLFRFAHALIWDLLRFINWRFEFKSFVVSTLLGEGTLFTIIRPLLDQDKTIFIDLEQFRDAFWFAAFTYIVAQLWNIFKVKATGEVLYPSEKQASVILDRYEKYKRKYHSHIESILNKEFSFPNPSLKEHFLCLVYAIMIFEDHNRPSIVRLFEYLKKIALWHSTCSLGIMQVQTKKMIGNKKSIELAIQKMYKPFSESDVHEKLYKTVTDYNPCDDYYREVISIYEEIKTSLCLNEIGTHRVVVTKRKYSTPKSN